jgi:hypothetical protein
MHDDPEIQHTHQLAEVTSVCWEGSIEVCVSPPWDDRAALSHAMAKANRTHECNLTLSALICSKRDGGTTIHWGRCFTKTKEANENSTEIAPDLVPASRIVYTFDVPVGRTCDECSTFIEGERPCPVCGHHPDQVMIPLDEWYAEAEPADP